MRKFDLMTLDNEERMQCVPVIIVVRICSCSNMRMTASILLSL